MPRKSSMFLQFLTYGMLIGLSHGTPLIGRNVADARPGEFLFVVSIAERAPNNDTNFVNRHFCTGTLISSKHVLTAAHCFLEITPRDVEVIAGSANVRLGHKYYPETWITYGEWKLNHNEVPDDFCHEDNDIGIITLEGEGVTYPKIHPAKILTLNPTDLDGSNLRIAGWGNSEDNTKPLVLKTGVTIVIPNNKCSKKVTRLMNQKYDIPNNYFCSLAIPWLLLSFGDSGGPIFNKNNQVVGVNRGVCPILSESYSTEYRNRNQVNLHLHVYHYRNFITSFKITT